MVTTEIQTQQNEMMQGVFPSDIWHGFYFWLIHTYMSTPDVYLQTEICELYKKFVLLSHATVVEGSLGVRGEWITTREVQQVQWLRPVCNWLSNVSAQKYNYHNQFQV